MADQKPEDAVVSENAAQDVPGKTPVHDVPANNDEATPSATDPKPDSPPAAPAVVVDTAAADDADKADAEEGGSRQPTASRKPIKGLGTAKKAGVAKKKGTPGNGEGSGGKEFKVGDLVMAKLKGYPPWREWRATRRRW